MKKIFLLLALIYSISACTDLNIDPHSRLTDDSAYKEKSEFLNGLAGVYSTLGVWSEVVYKIGSSADEMIFPARGGDWKGDLQSMHTHTWNADNGEIGDRYTGISNVIAAANAFIYSIDNSDFKDDSDVLVIRSEARFVRAFAYFLMIDLFGNVPLVTTATYDPNNTPKQNTRAEIYKFVEDELDELSKTALPETSVYGRVNRYTAKTLLAKLYLNAEVYLGSGNAKWQEVVNLTQEIMTGSDYILENNFKDVFKWDNFNSKEIIFAMVCNSSYSTPENISYLFSIGDLRAKYGSFASGWNGASVTPTFYRSYDDANDVRLEAFIVGPQFDTQGNPIMQNDDFGTNRQLTYYIDYEDRNPDPNHEKTYHPVDNADHWDGGRGGKYLMDGIGGTMVERGLNNDMPILRYADVLMMRAEALFRLDPSSSEALTLVNQVRTRNGNNSVYTLPSLTEENLLAERGREFAWEGWRRNDQIRFGTWGDAWDFKAASDAKYKLFPIPQVQIDSNPNLKQNDGYQR